MSAESQKHLVLDSAQRLDHDPAEPTNSVAGAAPRRNHASPLDDVHDAAGMDASVYLTAYHAAIPRMHRMFFDTTHLEERTELRRERPHPRGLFRRVSLAYAAALIHEHDDELREDESIHEFVRTSLIWWQMSIRHDGRPIMARPKALAWQMACAAEVAKLVEETSTFHTEMLMEDLNNHLTWLGAREAQRPSAESALIGALADGALVLRNPALRQLAKKRAEALLATQSEEGWFPEFALPDVGRLSLTVDAMARLCLVHGWELLHEPLARAVRFLLAVGVMDCRHGVLGAYAPSPLGAEYLAPCLADAACLARQARSRVSGWARDGFSAWPDDFFCLLLPRLVKASLVAAVSLPPAMPSPSAANANRHFPRAGVTVHTTDSYRAVIAAHRGGSIQVTWYDRSNPLCDTGIVVVYPHSTRRSASGKTIGRTIQDEQRVSCEMSLKSSRRIWRDRWFRDRRENCPPAPPTSATHAHDAEESPRWFLHDYDRLTHDTCTREITLGHDSVRIRDLIRCRLPCQAVVCQVSRAADTDSVARGRSGLVQGRAPIYVAGGRRISIDRLYRHGKLVAFRAGGPGTEE